MSAVWACTACGRMLARQEAAFVRLCAAQFTKPVLEGDKVPLNMGKALDALKISRGCCRRMFISARRQDDVNLMFVGVVGHVRETRAAFVEPIALSERFTPDKTTGLYCAAISAMAAAGMEPTKTHISVASAYEPVDDEEMPTLSDSASVFVPKFDDT